MTGIDDVSQAIPGVTIAAGGDGTTAAQPMSINAIGQLLARKRDEDDDDEAIGAKLRQLRARSDRTGIKTPAALRAIKAAVDAAIDPPAPATQPSRSAQLDMVVDKATEQACVDIVKQARNAVSVADKQAASSVADYVKKVRFLSGSIEGGDPTTVPDAEQWTAKLHEYAASNNSFRAYRAAVCWHLRKVLRVKLSAQDRVQRTGKTHRWADAVNEVNHVLRVLQSVQACSREDAQRSFDAFESRSKKHDLKKIEKAFPDWRTRILSGCRGSPYEEQISLLDLVGCRPQELTHGVQITLDNDGKLRVRIEGAKVTETSGQPWREILIDESVVPGHWLNAVKVQGTHRIELTSKDALRSYLDRLSKKVLPGAPAVSAYVFRHALARTLRAEGATDGQVGAVLGHTAAETQKYYGRRGRGSRKVHPDSRTTIDFKNVDTSRPVRPKDRAGLEKLKSSRKSNSIGPKR